MSLESFLQKSWFTHIKEEWVGLKVPMVYIFRYNTSLSIQNILWLEVSPDFTLVRNVELISQWTCVKRIDPKTPIVYTMYTFNDKVKKVWTIGWFVWQKIKWKDKTVRLQSAQEILQTMEGVWIHRKYLTNK